MPESSESEENESEGVENAELWQESEKAEHTAAQKAERSAKTHKYGKIALTLIVVAAIAAAGVFVFLKPQPTALAVTPAAGSEQQIVPVPPITEITTFSKTNDQIETLDGKPVIRLFSTTWCPHCKWIKETFDETVQEYVAAGKIVARHWEVDLKDDALSPVIEGAIPESEYAVFTKFNPDQRIPTFVFGGKYYRVGNGYEMQGDAADPGSVQSRQHLEQEKQEFKAVIEALLKENK